MFISALFSIAKIWKQSIFIFNFFEEFPCSFPELHSHQWCMTSLFSPHSYQHLLFLIFFDNDHSNVWRDTSLYFWFAFSDISDIDHLFRCLWAVCVFFGKISIEIFCSFFNWIFFSIEFYEFLYYILDISSLSGHMIFKYFFLFHKLSFHFVDGFLCYDETY